MATYQITAPNGKTYRIQGPAGATDEQIRAEVVRQFPDADPTLKQFPDTVRGPDIAEQPSTMEHLAAGSQNAAASAIEGVVAAPYDMLANAASGINQGINYAITEGGGALLNALGAGGAADRLRGAGRVSRNALANTGGNAVEAIQRISPTPEGMEGARFAGQFASSLMVPFGPKPLPRPVKAPTTRAASEAGGIVEAGQREGVRVMTSDVRPPQSFIGKNARALGERIPFAGTAGPRMKQHEERVEAVKRLASDFGIEGAEEVIGEVADDLANTRGGRIAALAGRKDKIIDGLEGAVETPQAVGEIDKQIARLKGINDQKLAPVIRELERFRSVLTSGKSLREIEENRRLLGEMFADQNLASVKGVGQKAINAVYAPLRDDMGAFIKRQGGDEAFNAWKKSNDELAAMAGELDVRAFKSVLNDAQTTPENVAKLLFSKKPSDVRRLYANLSPKGKEKAKSAVLFEAIRKSGGLDDISPQKFANSLKDFGRTTGIIFGDDAPRVEGIARLLKATQQASVAAAHPPTGAQNTVPVVAAILADWMGSAGAAMTTAGTAGLAARLYESAPVRNLLVSLSKTPPGSKAEGAVLERIGKTLTTQVEIQTGRGASNDNTRLVSEVAANPEREQ